MPCEEYKFCPPCPSCGSVLGQDTSGCEPSTSEAQEIHDLTEIMFKVA